MTFLLLRAALALQPHGPLWSQHRSDPNQQLAPRPMPPGRAVLRFCDDEALLIDRRSRTIYLVDG
jgi:hypothetical protein